MQKTNSAGQENLPAFQYTSRLGIFIPGLVLAHGRTPGTAYSDLLYCSFFLCYLHSGEQKS